MNKKRILTDVDQRATDNLRQIWDSKKRQLGLTQSLAAKQLGFSNQSAVSQYLNGDIILGVEATLKFASILQVPPTEIRPELGEYIFYSGNNTSSQHAVNVQAVHYQTRYYTIPMLVSGQVEEFLNGTLDKEILSELTYYPLLPNTSWGNRVYGIHYQSDAMQPTIASGDILYVAPDVEAAPGQLTVWDFAGESKPTVGKVVTHGIDRYLSFSNKTYASIKIPENANYWGAVVAKIGIFD